jgi:hypothetical protein
MKQTMVEYRTTKLILEGVVRKADKYSKCEYKTIFDNEKMFYCVKPVDSKSIYEVKITKKKREAVRLEPNHIKTSADKNKENYLLALSEILECVFKNVSFNDGNILVSDDNNDYVISLVKKASLNW